MLFNSLAFVAFFAGVLALHRLLPGRARNPLLLAASLTFYAAWDWRFLGLLVATAGVDYVCALRVEDRDAPRRRAWLALSIVSNLAVLAAFKYAGFFARELAALLATAGIPAPVPVLDLILPMGISFYTFQAMAYTIDVYRGDVPATRDFSRYLLFISFFPQLVAGPIERCRDLMPQLAARRRPTAEQIEAGTWLLLWGYVKKVVVADNLAPLVEAGFDDPDASGFAVLLAAYAFTWQIYCDFSGYSDIARGLAKWLGIDLSVNFDAPFLATSPRDLWRRWHISLSRWLRDYLYVPLGGNRRAVYRNLLLTMVLGGLWHGANWTFLAWGAVHGLALAAQRALPAVRVPRAVAVVATFHLTCGAFVLFRAHSLGQVGDLARRVIADPLPSPGELGGLNLLATLAALVLGAEIAARATGGRLALPRLPLPVQGLAAAAMALAIAFLGATYGYRFLYFQF